MTASTSTRTYWLSFVDPDRPEGQRFLGACLVDVSEDDAARALVARPDMHDTIDGPWIAAACRKAWTLGCNPGGQVAAMHVDPTDARTIRNLPRYPKGKLLLRADLERIEATIPEGDLREP